MAVSGGADLATAKVDALTKLSRGSYGIILVDGELMIGKGKRHNSTSPVWTG